MDTEPIERGLDYIYKIFVFEQMHNATKKMDNI